MPAARAKSFGAISVLMSPCLQNATFDASENCCSLHDAQNSDALHTASMESVDVKAGTLLRAWREFKGLTQAQLAESVQTTPAVISLLDAGERKLSPKWLFRLAPALGTTPGRLLDSRPDALPSSDEDLFYQIPDERRALAREVLKQFRAEPNNGTDG